MMKQLIAAVVLGGVACAAAAQTCVKVASGEPMPAPTPAEAAKLVLVGPNAAGTVSQLLDVATTAGGSLQAGAAWRVTTAAVARIRDAFDAAPANQRARFRLVFVAASGSDVLGANQVMPFFGDASVDSQEITKACAASAPPVVGTPADSAVCAAQLARLESRPYLSWVLFNSIGTICYAPFPLRQRDTLAFGLVLNAGEKRPDGVGVNVTGCTAPTAAPVVLSTGQFPAFATTSGTAEGIRVEEVLPRVECASANPVMAVTFTREGKAGTAVNQTLSLVERYTATIHLGVLNSRLHQRDFALRTVGGQTTVVDKEATGRGPEYVAMVVVEALPRYFERGLSYPGRDPLHDNEPRDRLGLILSFGLKEPGKRFGVGFGYEIAKGINVVAVHEWLKQNRLDGINEGDTFTGSDIPTRREWSKGWSFGLSFDLGYVTQIFGAKK